MTAELEFELPEGLSVDWVEFPRVNALGVTEPPREESVFLPLGDGLLIPDPRPLLAQAEERSWEVEYPGPGLPPSVWLYQRRHDRCALLPRFQRRAQDARRGRRVALPSPRAVARAHPGGRGARTMASRLPLFAHRGFRGLVRGRQGIPLMGDSSALVSARDAARARTARAHRVPRDLVDALGRREKRPRIGARAVAARECSGPARLAPVAWRALSGLFPGARRRYQLQPGPAAIWPTRECSRELALEGKKVSTQSSAWEGEGLKEAARGEPHGGWAELCPSAPAWRKKLTETAQTGTKRGAEGIYVEGIASARPEACPRAEHEHVGRAREQWTHGVRGLLGEIRQALGDSYQIVTDGPAEPYLDLLDAFVSYDTAAERHALFGDRYGGRWSPLPMFTAVYHEYIPLLGLGPTLTGVVGGPEELDTHHAAEAVSRTRLLRPVLLRNCARDDVGPATRPQPVLPAAGERRTKSQEARLRRRGFESTDLGHWRHAHDFRVLGRAPRRGADHRS